MRPDHSSQDLDAIALENLTLEELRAIRRAMGHDVYRSEREFLKFLAGLKERYLKPE